MFPKINCLEKPICIIDNIDLTPSPLLNLCVLCQEELQSMKLQLEETKKHFDSQRAEQQNLHKIISDNDSEYTRLKGQLQQVKKKNASGLS